MSRYGLMWGTWTARMLLGAVALTGSASSASVVRAQSALSDSVIMRAIAEGKRYASRDKYLSDGATKFRCNVAGFWSFDGISKGIQFFTDFDAIAAAAAAANREMRPFTLEQAKALPLTGLLLANVGMTARGKFPMERLQNDYVAKGVHLVLQVGDSLIQPITKGDVATTSSGDASAMVLLNWYKVGNMSLLTATPIGFASSHYEQEFVFPISPATVPADIRVYLIHGDGDRKEVKCHLAGIAER